MMAVEAMSKEEIDWVDAYHRQVWDAVSGRLEGDAEALAFFSSYPLFSHKRRVSCYSI